MSDPLKIALVAEGPTDRTVIDAAIRSMVGERSYSLKLLQPEESVAFAAVNSPTSMGNGWGGIYRWCRMVTGRNNGRLEGDILFLQYDILIMHLDADVAGKRYSDCGITVEEEDLPCEEACPPPSATTDRLRTVLLRWVGQDATPGQVVLCTPSKSTET